MLVFLLLALLWTPPLVLIHELGHAAAALRLTSGPVLVKLGRGNAFGVRRGRLALAMSWPAGGECLYLARTLRGSVRSEAWIAAAGPAVSLATTVLLGLAALETHGALREVLGPGAL